MKTGLSSVERPSRLGLIEGEVSKIIAFQGNRAAGSKSKTNTSGMMSSTFIRMSSVRATI